MIHGQAPKAGLRRRAAMQGNRPGARGHGIPEF